VNYVRVYSKIFGNISSLYCFTYGVITWLLPLFSNASDQFLGGMKRKQLWGQVFNLDIKVFI
jgi:hypothetical protein